MEKITTLGLNVLVIAWTYLRPVHEILIAVSVIILLDFITGVLASKKQKRKITSSALRRTITKTFIYQATIIFSLILEKHFAMGLPVVKVVASVIALTETKSFFENVEVCTGINFYKKIFSKINGEK